MKIPWKKSALLAGLGLIVLSLAVPAGAQSHGGGHGSSGHGGGGAWHGGGPGRGGGGHGGGWHGGGAGWWGLGLGLGLGWDAALLADPYYYAPYPGYADTYEPPPAVMSPAPPPTAGAAPAPESPPGWYYCDSAKAYYPYVQGCAEPWRVVPAVPPRPAQ